MSTNPTPIDISQMPELLNLVEEVEATNTPRALKRDNKVVAVLSPVEKQKKKTPRQTKIQQSLAAIGSWSDIDADKVIADIERWRAEGSRPATRP
jgi:hypothetical protein